MGGFEMSDVAREVVREGDLETIEAEVGQVAKLEQIEEGAPWNAVETAFLKRRSIRKFKKKRVPAHLIRRMLEVGRFAPSQGNCEPWKFVVDGWHC
jgi:hypothetical protein